MNQKKADEKVGLEQKGRLPLPRTDGEMTTYLYDNRNRPTRETRTDLTGTASYTTYTEYDNVGNPVSITPPGGGQIEYTYDGVYRKIEESFPDGASIRYSYDKNDNPKYIDGANGYRSYFFYNALNQLIEQRDPEDGVTYYGYNEDGLQSWFKDAIGNIRTTDYDDDSLFERVWSFSFGKTSTGLD